jgi:hypothetical protein
MSLTTKPFLSTDKDRTSNMKPISETIPVDEKASAIDYRTILVQRSLEWSLHKLLQVSL